MNVPKLILKYPKHKLMLILLKLFWLYPFMPVCLTNRCPEKGYAFYLLKSEAIVGVELGKRYNMFKAEILLIMAIRLI